MLQLLHRNQWWESWNELRPNGVAASGHTCYTQSRHLNHSNHPSHTLYNNITVRNRIPPPPLRPLLCSHTHWQLVSAQLHTSGMRLICSLIWCPQISWLVSLAVMIQDLPFLTYKWLISFLPFSWVTCPSIFFILQCSLSSCFNGWCAGKQRPCASLKVQVQ